MSLQHLSLTGTTYKGTTLNSEPFVPHKKLGNKQQGKVIQFPTQSQFETKCDASERKPLSEKNVNVPSSSKIRSQTSKIQRTIKIVDTNPFYDTDLVVYSDKYKGQIPANGIRKSEFLEITNLFEEICAGRTKFQIKGDSNFTDRMQSHFKKLLTRDIGRRFIKDLLKKPYVEINISYGEHSMIDTEKRKNSKDSNKVDEVLLIKMCENHFDTLTITSKGLKKKVEVDEFIILAHEMVHGFYHGQPGRWPNYTFLPASIKHKFTSSEEFATIMGHTITGKKFQYSENAFRKAFGLPLRSSHLAPYIKEHVIDLVCQGETIHNSCETYAISLIGCGLYDELKEFLNANKECITKKTTSGHSFFEKLINICAFYDDVNAFKIFEELYPNFVESHYFTFINDAIQFQSMVCLKYLLCKEAVQKILSQNNPDSLNLANFLFKNFPQDPEMRAVFFENLGILAKLGLLNQDNPQGELPLYTAICHNLSGYATGFGANINAQNRWGQTALHLAVQSNNVKGIQLLLGLEATIDIVDNDNHTALQVAASSSNASVISLLFSNYANPFVVTKNNETLLHLIASNPVLNSQEKNWFILSLLKLGIPAEQKDSLDRTYLDCLPDIQELLNQTTDLLTY